MKTMKVTIDRFEGNYAVCEKSNKKMINIEKVKIPPEAKEGDVLLINGDSAAIDSAATGKRKAEIDKLVNDVWE